MSDVSVTGEKRAHSASMPTPGYHQNNYDKTEDSYDEATIDDAASLPISISKQHSKILVAAFEATKMQWNQVDPLMHHRAGVHGRTIKLVCIYRYVVKILEVHTQSCPPTAV